MNKNTPKMDMCFDVKSLVSKSESSCDLHKDTILITG